MLVRGIRARCFWILSVVLLDGAVAELTPFQHIRSNHQGYPQITRLRGGSRVMTAAQCCRLCAKSGHNARTCPSVEKPESRSFSSSQSDSSDSTIAYPRSSSPECSPRVCKCGSKEISHGISSSADGFWKEFLCSPCALHSTSATNLRMRCAECRRHAYFGPSGGNRKNAIHCKVHRLYSEVNLISKLCAFEGGCNVRPTFGDPSERVLRYCNKHKRTSDVDLVHKRCQHPGCKTISSFGDSDHGRPTYCAAHRRPGQFDVVNRKCRHPEGCDIQATFGSSKDGAAIFCAQHRGAQDVDVTSRRCAAVEGCSRQPHFGTPGDRVPIFCARHRAASHQDLLNRRCAYSGGCQKRAVSYAVPVWKAAAAAGRGSERYCREHAMFPDPSPDMLTCQDTVKSMLAAGASLTTRPVIMP